MIRHIWEFSIPELGLAGNFTSSRFRHSTSASGELEIIASSVGLDLRKEGSHGLHGISQTISIAFIVKQNRGQA